MSMAKVNTSKLIVHVAPSTRTFVEIEAAKRGMTMAGFVRLVLVQLERRADP